MRDALTQVAIFVPKLLLFIVIVVIGYVLVKAVQKALEKLLEKVGFDRAVERGGIKRALAKSNYDASGIVSKIVYYLLLLLVLQLAFGVFGPNPISDLLTTIIAFLPRLLVAIVIIVIAAAIAAAVKGLIQNSLSGLSYGSVLANIAGVFILGFGIIAALNQIRVATTVTTPLLITVLATIGGVIVVGAGGGLIKPMQKRWEGWLAKVEEEAPKIKQEADAAPSVKEQANQAKDEAKRRHEQDQAQDRQENAAQARYEQSEAPIDSTQTIVGQPADFGVPTGTDADESYRGGPSKESGQI